MTTKKLILAQTSEELKFIINKYKNNKNLFCVPLDLETQLYCLDKNINFFNPLNYIRSSFHRDSLIESEKMLKNISFAKDYKLSEITTIKAFLRFHFNSVIFLIELINKILLKEKIEEIIVSGWHYYKDTYSRENYFVSYLAKSLFKEKTLVLNKIKKDKIRNQFYQYHIEINKPNTNNTILFTNLGYNIFRIIKIFKKKYNDALILSPKIQSLSLAKKILFKFFNVHFFDFKKIKSKKNFSVKLPNIRYNYKKKFNLTKILNRRIKLEKWHIIQNRSKYFAISDFFLNYRPQLIVSNNSRDVDGQFLDSAKKKHIPLMCIPHGTISTYFNKYDKIYKNIIADSITYQGGNFISQSNISSLFYKKEKRKYKNIIRSGNLLFCEGKNLVKKNKKILYAVTSKDFQSIQYLGVEMYFEYLDNLSFLNKLAKKNDLKIFVKNHPTISMHTKSLQKRFRYLFFTDEKIQKILSETSLTISFSSSVIEDSLYNYNPVILLDRWKRYKHCEAEIKPNLKNKSVYYINNDKNLLKCINTIFKSKTFNFDKYILERRSATNIQNLFQKYF